MTNTTMPAYVYHDGGRSEAGYRGIAKDCVCRAIAIAADRPYQEVYDAIAVLIPGSPRNGVPHNLIHRVMDHFGLRWTPTMAIGSGCRTHVTPAELPAGRIIVRMTRHVAAVVDGVLHDNHDSSRGGTRAVYGYWSVA